MLHLRSSVRTVIRHRLGTSYYELELRAGVSGKPLSSVVGHILNTPSSDDFLVE